MFPTFGRPWVRSGPRPILCRADSGPPETTEAIRAALRASHEIAERRRAQLASLRAALETGDTETALRYARDLVGLEA